MTPFYLYTNSIIPSCHTEPEHISTALDVTIETFVSSSCHTEPEHISTALDVTLKTSVSSSCHTERSRSGTQKLCAVSKPLSVRVSAPFALYREHAKPFSIRSFLALLP